MVVTTTGLTDTRFRHAVEKACIYYADLLLPKHIIKHITVDIEFTTRLEKDADGYCDITGHNTRGKPREFEIQIHKNKSKRYMMMTLAHEFVHLKQYAMGELDEKLSVWKGKRISANTDYWDTPWEIEAHGRESGLWSRFAKAHKITYKKTIYQRDN